MTTLVTLLEDLRGIDTQSLEYELRRLEGIKEWALERLGIDYREGDRVRLTQDIPCGNGWAAYAECLVRGATGTVKRIDFSPPIGDRPGAWFVDFTPDIEWKVWTSYRDEVHRVWNGTAATCPPGMEPMSDFDQRGHPDGKHHVFMFRPEWMERVQGEAGEVAE